MKQIEKDTVCYYCLGCGALENEDFKPVMRCNNFAPDRANWREMLAKELIKKCYHQKKL